MRLHGFFGVWQVDGIMPSPFYKDGVGYAELHSVKKYGG